MPTTVATTRGRPEAAQPQQRAQARAATTRTASTATAAVSTASAADAISTCALKSKRLAGDVVDPLRTAGEDAERQRSWQRRRAAPVASARVAALSSDAIASAAATALSRRT